MAIIDNIWTLIEIGGPVMIPIGLVSVFMWIMIMIKADWIWRSGRNTITLKEAFGHLNSGRSCPVSCCPRTLALNYYMNSTPLQHGVINGVSEQLFLEVAVRRQISTIYKFIPAILILAAVAPLLGLFGTVSGMVETFKVIGQYGMGNAQAMASGIKEAMITTQTGLLVAIPGVFVGQALKKKSK